MTTANTKKSTRKKYTRKKLTPIDRNHVPAKLNNNYAEKYKTKEYRIEVFKLYCDHLRQGYSKLSFSECSHTVIHNFIKKYEKEDQYPYTHELNKAYRECRAFYENKLISNLMNKELNFKAIQFCMINRFPDVLERIQHRKITSKVENKVSVNFDKIPVDDLTYLHDLFSRVEYDDE